MNKKFNYLFVTFFGIGTLKYAPGSITSLITTIFLYSCFHILNLPKNVIFYVFVLVFLYAFYAISEYIKLKKDKDPKEVVIDEVVGQTIPIYLFEVSHGTDKNSQEAILFYIYIFILFRFFDIKKPFPIGFFDKKFKNSFGVIIDDVIAGFYVVLTLIIFMIIKVKFLS